MARMQTNKTDYRYTQVHDRLLAQKITEMFIWPETLYEVDKIRISALQFTDTNQLLHENASLFSVQRTQHSNSAAYWYLKISVIISLFVLTNEKWGTTSVQLGSDLKALHNSGTQLLQL